MHVSTVTSTVSRALPVRGGVVLRHMPLVLLVALFVVAFAIRLVHANEPPLNFHATRQYRSLIIARAYYVERAPSVAGWERQVAQVSRQRQGTLEPPIMELLVAASYHVVGGERFWLPRVLSSLFWLIGGGFLYMIAGRLADVPTALFATAVYLFAPFAIVASTSFQPDPLMVMLSLASVAAVIRYFDAPSNGRLIGAALLAALACLVKPVSLFVIVGVFAALNIHQYGLRQASLRLRNYAFLLLALLPTGIVYAYGIFGAGVLRTQAQSSFLPQLVLTPFFWRGWLGNVDTVIGLVAFVGALLGLFLFRDGFSRAVMIGLWGGYAAFCLVFSYHVATHDYYHLLLLPIVALSLGPVVALVLERVLVVQPTWYARTALVLFAMLALLVAMAKAEARLRVPDGEQRMRMAAEIGGHVRHNTNTVYLSADYGLPLEYHGKLAGTPWPLVSDLEWERLAGLPVLPAEERFAAWFALEEPEYFIVADMQEFDAQPDLRQFLSANFPIVARSDDQYLIFDVRDEQP